MRLRRNWLSRTVFCAGSEPRVQFKVFALIGPLAFTHSGLASGALDSSPTDAARTPYGGRRRDRLKHLLIQILHFGWSNTG
jgi:hypothetical protein